MPVFRALIVAAVSTKAQVTDDKGSLPQQVTACAAVCEARGWVVADTVQIEGHSRNYEWLDEIMADSPAYAQMVRLIRQGIADLVLCRDYDRLWRTDALRAQFTAVCRQNGVQVFSLNQPVEPTDPALLQGASDSQRIIEALSGVISESENRTRTRRLIAGKEARVRRGLALYSNNVPYGYKRDDDRLMVIDPPAARWVRWIFERRAYDRWGYMHIAKELMAKGVDSPARHNGKHTSRNIWYDNSVKIILHNPFYRGHIRWGDVYCEDGQHEAIIDDDLWNAAQMTDRLHAHYRARASERGNHLLTGLITCGHCDHAMTYVPSRSSYFVRCAHYLSTHGRRCQANGMKARPIEAFVLRQVQRMLRSPDDWLAARASQINTSEVETQIAALQNEIAALDALWQRWDHAYEIGAISLDEMLLHRQRIQGQREALAQQISEHRASLGDSLAVTTGYERVATLANRLDALPMDDLRHVYRQIIRTISLRQHEQPVIHWL